MLQTSTFKFLKSKTLEDIFKDSITIAITIAINLIKPVLTPLRKGFYMYSTTSNEIVIASNVMI